MPRNPPETQAEWQARGKARYAKHKAKIAAQRKALRSDPEYAETKRAWHRAYYAKDRRKHSWGITQVEFNERLAAQGNRCAICETEKPGAKDWHFDHNHNFDKRDPAGHRGILCANCNVMLGMAKEDPEILATAILYLNGWNN
jgi:hypothetical protein